MRFVGIKTMSKSQIWDAEIITLLSPAHLEQGYCS